MPTAARFRLCSRVLAWAGAFARSDMSSVSSASVNVCAGDLLLLSFVSLKPFKHLFLTNVLHIYV